VIIDRHRLGHISGVSEDVLDAVARAARLVRHADALILRLPPGHDLLSEVLARIRALPAAS
jgi:hypothetical protein